MTGWMPMATDPFAQNLRRLRREKGLTQKEVADSVGCARAYISGLENGSHAASMAILKKLAQALETTPAELLMVEEDQLRGKAGVEGIPIINESMRGWLPAPTLDEGRVTGDSRRLLCLPDVRGRDAFAAYLPDEAMAPAFGKGDLVVFSLLQEVADGAAALIDLGEGQAMFRRVLKFPGGGLRLQAANPKVEPILREKAEGLRMWPAIGRWEWLVRRRR